MTELVQQLLVDDADEELGWQERALCAQTDPESFFPEKGGSTREAKKVCLACEVRSECRAVRILMFLLFVGGQRGYLFFGCSGSRLPLSQHHPEPCP